MTTHTDRAVETVETDDDVSYAELTFALSGGIVAWLLRLAANAALVPYGCAIGSAWPIVVSSVVAALVTGVALASSWRFWRRREGTASWLGMLATAFNVLSLTGIVLETVPVLFFDLCS